MGITFLKQNKKVRSLGGIDPDAQGLTCRYFRTTFPHISSVQMASYRTLFGDAAYSDKLLLGVGARNYGLLKDATNTAFDLASNNGLKGWQYIDKGGNLVSTTRKIPANELKKQVKLGLKKLDEAKKFTTKTVWKSCLTKNL